AVFGRFIPSVTISGMTGHDAGIIGHDHRNTHLRMIWTADCLVADGSGQRNRVADNPGFIKKTHGTRTT
ncbi:hypothetical protein, partial [Polaromonas sp.]|uniref:hypothetical protein n=1 Tax=Polaromonas sp. TaxID=1869339 RepID=UPI0025D63ADC